MNHSKRSELKTLEWDILNPDRIIIWRLKIRGEQAIFNLEIKKKSGLSLNPDIHHSKVFSSDCLKLIYQRFKTSGCKA